MEFNLKDRPKKGESCIFDYEDWFEGFEKKHTAILNDVFLWMKQNKCMSSDASVVLKIYIQKEVLGDSEASSS